MQSQKNIDHMAMPGGPGAMFIMIHPQLAFPLFKALFDGPAHHGGFAHLRERHIARRIGEGKFGLSIRRLADKKPYRRVMREAIAGGIDKEAGHLGHDRPLAPSARITDFQRHFLERAISATVCGWG